MDTLTATLAVIGGVVTLLLVTGAGVVVLRQGSVKELRGTNTDLRAERDDWQRRAEEHDARATALEARVANLEGDNRRKDQALVRIGEQALGTADIRELAEAVRQLVNVAGQHDDEAERRHRATNDSLQSVVRGVIGLRDAVEKRIDPKTPEVPT